MKRAIRSDCYARWYRGSSGILCRSCIEFLARSVSHMVLQQSVTTTTVVVGTTTQRTLQKSILFTPLLPSAGPTGGEGDACPAPTISLTIWSFAIAFRAMVGEIATW